MKILIVDDSNFFRQQLRDILIELGYADIEMAEDGRQALFKLNREHFGLVFLDWEMPKLNGLQVLNVIRSHHSIYEIPVIMVTNCSEKKKIINAIKAGVTNYIVKPIDTQVVISKLMEIGIKKAPDQH